MRDIGPHVFYAGAGDAARVIKLALNLMVAGTAELLAECIALAESHDVRRDTLLEIVGASAVASPLVKYKIGPLLADDYESTFSSRLMRKDLDLVLESAAAGGVPLPITAVVHQLLQACISTGLGGSWTSCPCSSACSVRPARPPPEGYRPRALAHGEPIRTPSRPAGQSRGRPLLDRGIRAELRRARALPACPGRTA